MEENILNPHRHIILYAKGHYATTGSSFRDVRSILKYNFPEEKVTPDKTLKVLEIIAWKAIATTTSVIKDHKPGALEIVTALKPADVFEELFDFMWKTRKDTAKDFEELDDALEEIITRGLLVVIAGHPYGKEELGIVDMKVENAIYSGIF